MNSKQNFKILILFIVIGLILGGYLSELLGVILAQVNHLIGVDANNPIYSFFVTSLNLDFGMTKTVLADGSVAYQAQVIDLLIVRFPIAFGMNVNTCGVLGMIWGIVLYKKLSHQR